MTVGNNAIAMLKSIKGNLTITLGPPIQAAGTNATRTLTITWDDDTILQEGKSQLVVTLQDGELNSLLAAAIAKSTVTIGGSGDTVEFTSGTATRRYAAGMPLNALPSTTLEVTFSDRTQGIAGAEQTPPVAGPSFIPMIPFSKASYVNGLEYTEEWRATWQRAIALAWSDPGPANGQSEPNHIGANYTITGTIATIGNIAYPEYPNAQSSGIAIITVTNFTGAASGTVYNDGTATGFQTSNMSSLTASITIADNGLNSNPPRRISYSNCTVNVTGAIAISDIDFVANVGKFSAVVSSIVLNNDDTATVTISAAGSDVTCNVTSNSIDGFGSITASSSNPVPLTGTVSVTSTTTGKRVPGSLKSQLLANPFLFFKTYCNYVLPPTVDLVVADTYAYKDAKTPLLEDMGSLSVGFNPDPNNGTNWTWILPRSVLIMFLPPAPRKIDNTGTDYSSCAIALAAYEAVGKSYPFTVCS